MSAFVCGDKTVKLLAIFAAQSDPSRMREARAREDGNKTGLRNIDDVDPYPTEIALQLHAENVRSVNHLYAHNPAAQSAFDPPTVTYRDIESLLNTDLVQVLKSAQCFEYQACETDDWPTSLAHKYLEQAKWQAIRKLPGWDSADWG